MKWWLTCMRKYVDFSGRARRKEYWMFTLFNLLFSLVPLMIDFLLGTDTELMGYGLFGALFGAAILLPTTSATVRRLHDIGMSGWWIFIGLFPLVGDIWLLGMMVTNSEAGDNQYGPNPKMILA